MLEGKKTFLVQPTRHPRLALMLFCSALFMVVLDFSIVTVALPAMQQSLAFPPRMLQWVISAYSLTFGGFLLLGGRCADLFGRRRTFIIGLVLFSLASLVGGLAQSQMWLVAARAAQGLAAALLSPASLSLITTTFQEGPERNHALVAYGTAASLGRVTGVILGGVLTTVLGWRWVMFVNVPIGVAAAALALVLVQESHERTSVKHLDVPGAICVTLGLALLVYTLSEADERNWTSFQTIGLLFLALGLLALFIALEARRHDSLVPLSMFRRRALAGANVIALLWSMTATAWIVLLTLYLQDVLNYSALQTGLTFLPQGIVGIVVGTVAGQVISRMGIKRVIVIGLLIFAISVLMVTSISLHETILLTVLPGTIFAPLGANCAVIALSILATAGVADRDQGLVSGLLNTAQQIGGALGVAVTLTAATFRTTMLGGMKPGNGALIQGYQFGLAICVGFLVIGVFIALIVIRPDEKKEIGQA